MMSKSTVIEIVPEFGIPIRIEVDNMGTVRLDGPRKVLVGLQFASGKREVGGFVFASDNTDLMHANGKLVVCVSRGGRRGELIVAVDSDDGQTYDKPRLEIQGDAKGLHVKAFKPDSFEKGPVHLANIPIKVAKITKK